MKKVISKIACIILVIASLFAINIYASGSPEITVPQALIKPNDLYSVDYYSELSENISKSEIVILGDYDFSTEIAYGDSSNESEKSVTINDNKIKNSISNNSTSANKSDTEMRMVFIPNSAIEDQYQEQNAEVLRTALENGYTIFFETADIQKINQINRNIFESFDNSFIENETENEITNNDSSEEQKKSYFYVSKSKDGFTYLNLVDVYYNGDQIFFDRSVLEHAWSNRNNINYLADVQSYKAALEKEAREKSFMSVNATAGFNDYSVLDVTFLGSWRYHKSIYSYTMDYYLPNYNSSVSYRMHSDWTYLLSVQLSSGQRIWANVSKTEVIPNNTETTERPYYIEDAYFWSAVNSADAEMKSYAPANTPNTSTYTYGMDISATGGISAKDGASGSITIGASFSKQIDVSNITYVMNKYVKSNITGTTFQMAFDGDNNYTQNHSEHTSVTFFKSSPSTNSIEFYNKMKYVVNTSNILITKKTHETEWFPLLVTYNSNWSNDWLK